ncbi:MAG: hypothetical protein ABIH23_10505, partial [bacterium]
MSRPYIFEIPHSGGRRWFFDTTEPSGPHLKKGDKWTDLTNIEELLYSGTAWQSPLEEGTNGVFKLPYDAAAYMTITQADGGGVTFDSVSDGTPGFAFSDKVDITGVLTVKADAAAYFTATVADGGGVTFDCTSDGTAEFTFSDKVTVQSPFTVKYDAAAYMTITQADGGAVTFNSVSDGTAGFAFSNKVTIAAGAVEGINVGAFNSTTQGYGTTLARSGATAANRFYSDDGGAVLYGSGSVPDIRGALSRTMLTVDNTGGDIRVHGLMGQLKSHDAFWNDEVVSAVHGRLEIVRSAAAVVLGGYGVSAAVLGIPATSGTITVNTNHVLAGVAALSDFQATLTQTGKVVGVYVGKYDTTNWSDATSRTKWGYGVFVDPLSSTKGFVMGAEAFSAAGSGMPVDGVTLHSGCEFYFDDGGVKLAAGYTEAFRTGYLVSTAITTADVSLYTAHDYVYLAADVTTAGGVGATWGSMLVKTGVTITTSSGVCDFSGAHFTCDVPSGATIGTGTWACGVSVGGNLGGTHTGNAAGYRVRVPGAGKWDAGLRIEPTSCVEAIQVGTASFSAAGSGIPLDGVTQHSGIEIYFDDGGVKLAAGYTEAIMQGFLVSTEITTAD